MLEQAERHQVLKHLCYFRTVGFLPLEVDVNNWGIHPCVRSAWKRIIIRISFAIQCLHIVVQSLSLLCVVMFFRSTPLYQVILHMILASAYPVVGFWYYLLYIKYPETNAAVLRMTLTGSVDGCRLTHLASSLIKAIANLCAFYRQKPIAHQCETKTIEGASKQILTTRSDCISSCLTCAL